jgi:hypothetical protein
MKKVLLIIAVLGLLAPPLAEAQRWGSGYGPRLQAQKGDGGGREYRGGRDGGGREYRGGRDGGGREYRGGRDEQPPQRDERRQGRMTDEERRALHQDLDRANREIYRPAPRR